MEKERLSDYIVALVAPLAPGTTCAFASDDMGTLFTLTVPVKDDRGRVIGREGATISAIRHIVRLVGYQLGIRASVKIAD